MKKKINIAYNAPVTLSFVLLMFAATIVGFLTRGKGTELLFSTYRSSLLNPLTYLRFFTHVLGHGSWEHFIGNASYLLLLGPSLEEKYGKKSIVEVILITALITGIFNSVFFGNVMLCGASGVVFAFILLISFTGFKQGEIPLSFILVAVIYLGQQIYQGIFIDDNISNMAHIIGGVIGSVCGYALNLKKK